MENYFHEPWHLCRFPIEFFAGLDCALTGRYWNLPIQSFPLRFRILKRRWILNLILQLYKGVNRKNHSTTQEGPNGFLICKYVYVPASVWRVFTGFQFLSCRFYILSNTWVLPLELRIEFFPWVLRFLIFDFFSKWQLYRLSTVDDVSYSGNGPA